MNKKWKIFKLVAAILAVCIVIGFAYFLGTRKSNVDETPTTTTTEITTETTTTTQPVTEVSTTTTTQPVTEVSTTTTTQPAITEGTTQTATDLGDMKLVFYYQINDEFKMQDITSLLATSIEAADPISPESERKGSGETEYVEPEIRLYGVSEDASVKITYESEASKAKTFSASYNDGVTEFWYFAKKLYSHQKEGNYSFRLTITEPDKQEQTFYFKVNV